MSLIELSARANVGPMLLIFAKGFLASAALIVAIGAQNAFVLRQGLKREHVREVVLVCALSDVLLIALGVAGLGLLVQSSAPLLALARWGGAGFLLGYGALAARRAWTGGRMSLPSAAPMSLRSALTACLAFTFLNPHCWLDTVVLLGAISAQQPEDGRWVFGAGAAAASIAWFAALGYGARLLGPLFSRPRAWRLLDALVALLMWTIAASLLGAS